MTRYLAIIPARGGSKRLPRKNVALVQGQPMIAYPISSALKSRLFHSVVVSTEDDEIADVSRRAGATVIARPAALATDEAHELAACAHVLDELAEEQADPSAFCIIYPTAAFVLPDDLIQSAAMLDGPPEADVVMAVAEYPIHPYKALKASQNGYLEMMFPAEAKQRSQFYPKLVASCGAFYWMRTAHFRKDPNYYPRRLVGYELAPDRAIDIDTPADLAWAEKLMRIRIQA
jgi:N-acylneuraminate cytidylyltransferase